jgi:hypothetical protein
MRLMPLGLDDLLSMLQDDPEPEYLHVIADALAERGELLGEAMALGLSLDAGAPVGEAWDQFLREHQRTLLGPAAGWRALSAAAIEWRAGLVDTLKLFVWKHLELARFQKELPLVLASPALIRLRVLESGALESDGSLDRLWEALPPVPTLQTLRVGGSNGPHSNEHQITWLRLGAIGEAASCFPRLRELWCRGSWPEFKRMACPCLEELTVVSSTLSGEAVQDITHSPLPRLARLELATGDGEYGDSAGLDAFSDLLAQGHQLFPRLRHLGICNTPFTDDLVSALAKSAILPHLESIDLAQGVLTREGARRLLESKDAFTHLRRIELGDNPLHDRERTRLQKVLPSVRFKREGRRGPKDDHYVSISE